MCDVRVGKDVSSLAAPGDPSSREPAEIWIAGPTIFDHYVGDAELTRARKHDGWLQTGDLGYFDENGNLFVVDRLDSMLIVGGENVYPAEVEKQCTLLPGAAQIVLTAVDDSVWGKKLILVYKPEQGADPSINEWHRILVGRLAPFKIPQAYVSIHELGLTELPRKENGKLDRPALLNLLKRTYATAKDAKP
jgi:acyl-CoA synthetase (AMP-forming)/AMP-acid ligase II